MMKWRVREKLKIKYKEKDVGRVDVCAKGSEIEIGNHCDNFLMETFVISPSRAI